MNTVANGTTFVPGKVYQRKYNARRELSPQTLVYLSRYTSRATKFPLTFGLHPATNAGAWNKGIPSLLTAAYYDDFEALDEWAPLSMFLFMYARIRIRDTEPL